MQRLRLKPYISQSERWPQQGRIILAQYDDQSVVVYQAFSRKMGAHAVRHGRLDGPRFSLDRMSWLRTNFLWMMYQSDWGSKPEQSCVLAIWLRRDAFDAILAQAVHSLFAPGVYGDRETWQYALNRSEVRLQWDSDHNPRGIKIKRRAMQLGLSGETLRCYAQEWIIHIEDISQYVQEQAKYMREPEMLLTPAEHIYPVKDEAVAQRLGLDIWADR
ncbi:MAG: DUF4291 domain-containing protein [Anaerolineae bacterium]|nr:DUF4291 domain-containing protein [Anaerolineae bacterium]